MWSASFPADGKNSCGCGYGCDMDAQLMEGKLQITCGNYTYPQLMEEKLPIYMFTVNGRKVTKYLWQLYVSIVDGRKLPITCGNYMYS